MVFFSDKIIHFHLCSDNGMFRYAYCSSDNSVRIIEVLLYLYIVDKKLITTFTVTCPELYKNTTKYYKEQNWHN